MRKIFQYILMAVAVVVTASCSNDIDETLHPAGNGAIQFVVSDFPAFGESGLTRAIGTQDEGKTAWADGDKILVHLYSQKFGDQAATLTFDAESNTWESDDASLNYLENETPTITAVYAPDCEIKSDETIGLIEGKRYGEEEYIPAKTSIRGHILDISFESGRTYSRLRIAAMPEATLTVTTEGFTPAGATSEATGTYTLTADEKGNAYLYGTFAEDATVSVKQGDVTLKDYTFTAEKNPNGTEPGKSYALDARPKYFSISAMGHVIFAPGNLQYHPANNKWRFAESQTDYIGETNFSISSTYDGWIDSFGWSGNTGVATFGVSTSEDYNDYSGTFVDWGTNQIGDNAPNTWRTLSKDEYLFKTRTNADLLYGIAQVKGVNGMVVLPDNWETPTGLTFKSGQQGWDDDYSNFQSFTAEQWSEMEKAGALFLPANGFRKGTTMDAVVGYAAYYWSSTEVNSEKAYYMFFESFSTV